MEEKYKVLMIDDEQDIVNFFTRTFQNFPHIEFFSALHGGRGIELAKKERPQVVLLDLRMPGIGGEEALVELKKCLPATKFIIMTGWEEGGTRERIENEIGVDAYFPKPIDLEKVITKVMSLMMELVRESGCALLLVTHNRDMAAFADRRLLLEGGHLHEADDRLGS